MTRLGPQYYGSPPENPHYLVAGWRCFDIANAPTTQKVIDENEASPTYGQTITVYPHQAELAVGLVHSFHTTAQALVRRGIIYFPAGIQPDRYDEFMAVLQAAAAAI